MVTIAPMQWSNLRDIDAVEPINDGDTDCLIEIRDVLKKHGKMERLGVALLHSHFDLESDEILLESSDEENRTLITKAVKQADAGNSNIATILMLREGDAATMSSSWCRKYCRLGPFGGHAEKCHNVVPGK